MFDHQSEHKFLILLSVGRTIDELSISAPPTPYYFFYARVSCRVCIVPKGAKAMEYVSSWAFSTLCSVGYVILRARAMRPSPLPISETLRHGTGSNGVDNCTQMCRQRSLARGFEDLSTILQKVHLQDNLYLWQPAVVSRV